MRKDSFICQLLCIGSIVHGFLFSLTPSAAENGNLALPGFDPGSGLTEANITEIVSFVHEHYTSPGIAVAVVKDGEIFYVRGFGVRDIQSQKPVDENTIFQLASVSKTFAASTIAALVDAQKLDWAQPAREVIPHFQLYNDYVTEWVNAIDFLTHRAGFKVFFGSMFDELGYRREDVLHRLRFTLPNYSFREHPEYSNVGFFIAGQLASAATGQSFEEVVRHYITKPLGMNRTGSAYDLMHLQGKDNVARSHALMDGEPVVVDRDYSAVFVPAGGLASTASDLSHYIQMLVNDGSFNHKVILSKEAISTLFKPVIASEMGLAETAPISENTGYFYSPGWGVYYYNGHRVLEKGGALSGVRALVTLVPEQKFAVAILDNMHLTYAAEAIRAALLQQMFGQSGEVDLQAYIYQQSSKIEELLFGEEDNKEVEKKKNNHPLSAYTGTFNNDLFGVWEVLFSPEKDHASLILRAGPAKYTGTLKKAGENTLTVTWPGLLTGDEDLPFIVSEKGYATEFTFEGYRFLRLSSPQ